MSKIWSINERSEEQVRETDKFGEQHEGHMEGRGRPNPFDHFERSTTHSFLHNPSSELDEKVPERCDILAAQMKAVYTASCLLELLATSWITLSLKPRGT